MVSTSETSKARVESMLDTVYVVIFWLDGGLTLWRCARRTYLASERFLASETDALLACPESPLLSDIKAQ